MKKILRAEIRVWLRTVYLPVIYILTLGLLNFLCIPSFQRLTALPTPYYFLYHYRNMQANTVLLFAVMLFISFEMFSALRTRDMEETVRVHGKIGMAAGAKMIILGALALILFGICLAWSLAGYFVSGCNFAPLFWQVVEAHILNHLMPMAAAILWGAVLGLGCSRVKGYVTMCAMVFFLSPLSSMAFGALSRTGFSADRLQTLLRIESPNLQLVPDTLQGMPVDLQRWSLIILWCAAALIFLVGKMAPGGWGKRGAVLILSAVILCTGWYSLAFDESRLHQFENSITTTDEDLYYSGVPVQQEEPMKSGVSSYDIHLSLWGRLKAGITIKMDVPADSYNFTLYHTFLVSGVWDLQGEPLPYRQTGDYLLIEADGTDTFYMEYEGASHKFFTNDQAVLLPAGFAYYPIPGFHETRRENSVIPVETFDTAQFTLSLDAPCPVYTNLRRDGETYTGNTNGVTLLGGLIKEDEIDGLRVIHSPFMGNECAEMEEIREAAKEMAEFLDGITPKDPSAKVECIIGLPYYAFVQNCSGYVDHIIFSEENVPQAEDAAAAVTLANVPVQGEVRGLVSDYLRIMISDEVRGELLEGLENGTSSSLWKIKRAELLVTAYQRLGADGLQKSVINYIKDPNDLSCMDFLYEISGRDTDGKTGGDV